MARRDAELKKLEPLYEYRQSTHQFTLRPSSTVLVIVDLQYGSASPEYGYAVAYRAMGLGELVEGYQDRVSKVVIPNVARLLDTFRRTSAAVIYLTVGSIVGDYSDMPPRFRRGLKFWHENDLPVPYAAAGSREMTVLDEIAPRPGEPVIQKPGASGFTGSSLEAVLFNRQIREIVFCGVSTGYCVESTLRDAADRGFDVVLAEDGCADTTPEAHERSVRSCFSFGQVRAAAEVISELEAG